MSAWPVEVVTNYDEALQWADVVACLRLQRERGTGAYVPSLEEFTRTHGLTVERYRRLDPRTIILHPGPMNRGVEIDSQVADMTNAFMTTQVRNGVPVRMATLYLALSEEDSKEKHE
jgi:aspartate carbamoyltransferase catalytic subunit